MKFSSWWLKLGRFAKKHLWLILLIAIGALLVKFMFFPGIPPAGEEILKKRTLTSRTFSNGDGTYRLEAFGRPINFFDGWHYRPLNEASEPDLDYHEVTIATRPGNLPGGEETFGQEYASYQLDRAVSASVEQDNTRLIFRDAKKDVIFELLLLQAVAADSQKTPCLYHLIFDRQTVKVQLHILSSFLGKAQYPVTIKKLK